MSPMDKPKIAQKAPYVLDLDAGKYAWCACGLSQKQPFCDGSHKGTGFKPLVFELEEPKRVALCGCKQTGKPPFCDGTHKNL
ncbi:MAG TPA: CDGSH iron-sulfur domain-containing protein [Phaeodactylibacter sp.]|nr:CDGSH iron-sulfur domain-containing protein [Phaeodactylibacter sp.]